MFHPNPVGHLKDSFVDRSFDEVMKFRAVDPVAYLDWVFNRPGVATVGFKMWRSQNSEACDTLLAEPSVSKIIYERPNILAQFSSSMLVQATGVYNLAPERERSDALDHKASFNLRKFRVYLDKHRDTYTDLRQRAKGPVLDLSYTDILARGFGDTLAFLGVEAIDLSQQKQKLHGSYILHRFDDAHHDEIRTELGRIGHEDWCRE